jgi:hypothetical protein
MKMKKYLSGANYTSHYIMIMFSFEKKIVNKLIVFTTSTKSLISNKWGMLEIKFNPKV